MKIRLQTARSEIFTWLIGIAALAASFALLSNERHAIQVASLVSALCIIVFLFWLRFTSRKPPSPRWLKIVSSLGLMLVILLWMSAFLGWGEGQ
jgi:uncharacterized membrane protein (UPF0136 family)